MLRAGIPVSARRLDAVGLGATAGKNRQQATVIATDIKDLFSAQTAVEARNMADELLHARQHVTRHACAVVIFFTEQLFLGNVICLIGGQAVGAEQDLDWIFSGNPGLPDRNEVITQWVIAEIEHLLQVAALANLAHIGPMH